MNCQSCGAPLKEVRVKKPVYFEHLTMTDEGVKSEKILARYEEETEFADCPRCTGGC